MTEPQARRVEHFGPTSATPTEHPDDGRAYGRPKGEWNPDLVETSAGTPAGELLRRYWHPVARSSEATGLPRKVRLLGEDLILFRDGSGRPGLVEPRCCHRGTTLYYYETQVGQGSITLHSAETPASSDRGVSMVRRQFLEQVRVVASGGDPVGVSFDPDEPPVSLRAGNYVVGSDDEALPAEYSYVGQ